MSADPFQSAAENYLGNQDSPATSETTSSNEAPSLQSRSTETQSLSQNEQRDVERAVAELEKMDKFKFQGREWTAKDLEKAILRQQDYTRKTQSLAEERKSFSEQQKFYDNLYYDIEKIRRDPSLINQFLSVYPKQFHKIAHDLLTSNQGVSGQTAIQNQAQVPIELLSTIQTLQKFQNDFQTRENYNEIQNTLTDLKREEPKLNNPLIYREVLAQAYESHERGLKITPEVWKDIAKRTVAEFDQHFKTEAREKQKQQLDANKRAKDVASGGGTIGKAPTKFKSFDQITKYAMDQIDKR
jgi:hypothetical protein